MKATRSRKRSLRAFGGIRLWHKIMFRLRPDLTSNYSLLLASLFISFAIWLIAKQGDLMEDWVVAKIELSKEIDAEIQLEPAEGTVLLQFPAWQQDQIAKTAETRCRIEIDVDSLGDPLKWCGVEVPVTRDVALQESMVVKSELPSGAQAIAVRPSSVIITGKLRTRKAWIKVRTNGKPAEGYYLPKTPSARPASLFLTGSQEALDKLPRDADGMFYIEAEEIDLSGRRGYFEANSSLRLPDGVAPAPKSEPVKIIVGIEEVSATKKVLDVPIRVQVFSRNLQAETTPETVTVIVEGPRTRIEDLGPADFSVTLEDSLKEEAGVETKLALACRWHESIPSSIRENVTIADIDPGFAMVRVVASNSAPSGDE